MTDWLNCSITQWLNRSGLVELGQLGAFELLDFGQDGDGFVFQRGVHRVVIGVGHLAGLVIEVEVAQVFVDDFIALAQVLQAALVAADGIVVAQIKNVNANGGGQAHADGDSQRVIHTSVSSRACRRSASMSAPRSSAAATATLADSSGCPFHLRMNTTANHVASSRVANGMIHATRLKPCVVGAFSTVAPYFWTNVSSTP